MEYEPILVGAGCLALGYMFGRHCKAAVENQSDAPTTSDAACCAQITDLVSVDSKGDEVFEKPEKSSAKRDLAQLDVFDPHFFHKMLRKKDDMISAFKKQKMREVVRSKADDSDDEVLAQRLEFFMKSEAGTRASVNKPGKKTHHVTRSLSGLGALASPLDDDESSLDDTCRSPKTDHLMVTSSAQQTESVVVRPLINHEEDDDVDDHLVVVLPLEADMEVDTDAVVMQQSRLPTSPPPELLQLHDVRDRDQEEVPLHKLVEAQLFSSGKRRNSRWCEAKTQPIPFRWLGKLSTFASTFRKRKLWRRRSKAKQAAEVVHVDSF